MKKVNIIGSYLIIIIMLLAGCREKTMHIEPRDTVPQNTNEDNVSEVVSSNEESDSKGSQQQSMNEFSLVFDNNYISLNDWDKDIDIYGILGEPVQETIEVLGSGADTFAGSKVKALKYEGLTLNLFSPKNNENEFWIMDMTTNDKKYKTFRGITIGHTVSELKQAYKESPQVLDGRTDFDNCAYIFSDQEQYKYIWFEVEDGVVKEIKLYVETL